ncbi:THUMP domain-containing protein 2 isoform X2 [Periophthalmus magnuspinnatus]|uniref:THUMP domain-containing protein 2 isoform X2 n=1 Tax=Periophthalmus magnuspinnatus TaxID=409849 RepID=UPI002436692F|nr:THUMP domain-containing protein 2 isoform X2 [Periophthalmus magnuspinnatus]
MTDSSLGCFPVRYFCTAGHGMEQFLVEEVKSKVGAQDVIRLQGKVIFSSCANINSVTSLKSAERLFLLLNHEGPLKLPAHVNQAKASSLLQSKLTGDKEELARAAMLCISLQGAIKDRAINCQVQTEGVKKRDQDEQSHGEASQCKRKRLEHENPDGAPRDQQTERLPSVDPVTFRICCKCSGSVARYFSTQDVSKVLGASLTTLLGWRVDLKNPHLEVNVNLTDDYCLQGIPLTKFPLATRSYVQTTGLRSTVAWAMGSMAQIQPGSLVVDPMCGVGTILIEAAKEHNDTYFLGIDIDDEQLVKARGNIVHAHLEGRMQLCLCTVPVWTLLFVTCLSVANLVRKWMQPRTYLSFFLR